jgi:hypothetical protein
MHGLFAKIKHLGPTYQFLARKLPVCWLYSISDNLVIEHGWLHSPLLGECFGIYCVLLG